MMLCMGPRLMIGLLAFKASVDLGIASPFAGDNLQNINASVTQEIKRSSRNDVIMALKRVGVQCTDRLPSVIIAVRPSLEDCLQTVVSPNSQVLQSQQQCRCDVLT